MSGPDATAAAALSGSLLHPCFVGYLDFSGDPLRVTTAPYSVTFSSTGDTDLDGNTFDAMDPQIISVSEVQHKEDGSETVTASLSGLATVDTALLNIIGDTTLWRGRAASLWLMLYDTSYARVGNVWRFYTGRMMAAAHRGDSASQTIEITIESYLASLSQASNRSYLDQAYFDSGDLSAAASIAIANGNHNNGAGGWLGSGGMGGTGSAFGDRANVRLV